MFSKRIVNTVNRYKPLMHGVSEELEQLVLDIEKFLIKLSEKPNFDTIRTFCDNIQIPENNAKESYQLLVKSIIALQTTVKNIGSSKPKYFSLYMIAYINQLIASVQAITLKTKLSSFPYKPSKWFAQDFNTFCNAIEAHVASKHINVEIVQLNESVKIKIMEQCVNKDKDIAKTILKNPQFSYRTFTNRIRKEGKDAKFCEFSNVVTYLRLYADSSEILALCKKEPGITLIRQKALEGLNMLARTEYPYAKSLVQINRFLGFVDIYLRHCSVLSLPELFYQTRWGYHVNYMMNAAPDYIMFPSMMPLGIAELIKIHGVPLGFVGVNVKPEYVDGNLQTPREFFYHDLNHSRRMWEEMQRHASELKLPMDKYINKSDAFVEQLLQQVTLKDVSNPETKNLRRIMKVIIFEILHEEGLPAHPDIFIETLKREPGAPARFVNETRVNGEIFYSSDAPTAAILAYVYRKLTINFYDIDGMRIDGICEQKYRTLYYVKLAAKILAQNLGFELPNKCLSYADNDDGYPYDFSKKIEAASIKGETQEFKPIIHGFSENNASKTNRMKLKAKL